MAVRRFPLRGDLDLATVPDLQKELDVLFDATDDDIVLDCADLTFIDSTGIGLVVHALRALEVQGRRCTVENLNERCRRPFVILGLSEVLSLEELDPA
jgi:anti-sigma B factor antagonist